MPCGVLSALWRPTVSRDTPSAVAGYDGPSNRPGVQSAQPVFYLLVQFANVVDDRLGLLRSQCLGYASVLRIASQELRDFLI